MKDDIDICDETYPGESEFSEKETQHLRDFLLSIKDKLSIYLTFHSYGQFLMFPYGDDDEELDNRMEHVIYKITFIDLGF